MLAVLNDGPILKLSEDKEKSTTTVSVLKGKPMFGLYDVNGTARAEMSIDKDGSAGLSLADEKGKIIWYTPR